MKKLLGFGLVLVLAACGGSSSNPAATSNDIKSLPAYPDKKPEVAASDAKPAKPTEAKVICADAKPVEKTKKKALNEKEPSFGASSVAAANAKDGYKMADLEALEKKGGYEELLGHAEDVPPSQRTAPWEKLVTKAAAEYMQSLTAGSAASEGVWTSQAFVKRYPFLAKDNDFMTKRGEAAKVAADRCLKDSYRGQRCIDMMKELLQVSGTSPDLGFAFGKITRLNQNHYVAVPFFKWAIEQKKDGAAAYCSDEDLHLAVIAGLALPTEYDNANDAREIATAPCYDALKADLQKTLVESSSGSTRDNICSVMKAKGDL